MGILEGIALGSVIAMFVLIILMGLGIVK